MMIMLSHRIVAPCWGISSFTSDDLPTIRLRFSHKFVNSRGPDTMMREMSRAASIVVASLLLASFAQAQREFRSATRFDPPPESFNSPDSLKVIEELLKRGQFVEAATQIETLLRDNAHAITPVDERGLMSVGNWLDQAGGRFLKEVSAAYSA